MFFGKNSASESNESLLSNCRAQPVLFKTVQARAMKACYQIAERSLFYLKTVQARASRTRFHIAERSLFSSKS
ncbi:hypothetical protein [Leyella lascolaii]|uniref:hypothetical protein n=1 Tax=Leyella lascolaii TaxID=1776379 RepID=UPI0023549FEE|nr:hypothetical protein [Leyella lascolaii]